MQVEQDPADAGGSCGSAEHLGDVVGCTSAASSRGPELNLNLTAAFHTMRLI